MDYSITTYFGVKVEDKEKLYKAIKEAGFNSVMLSSDKRYEKTNGTILEQKAFADKNNLKIEQLHSTYNGFDLERFWQKGARGKKYFTSLKEDVDIASKIGAKVVVIHLSIYNYQITALGIRRLRELCIYAKEKNIKIAVENLLSGENECFSIDNVIELIKKVKEDNFGMCLDTGHANVNEKDNWLEKLNPYKKSIFVTHIHDNFGISDEHVPLGQGNIDIEKLKEFFEDIEISLSSEVLNVKTKDYKEALNE